MASLYNNVKKSLTLANGKAAEYYSLPDLKDARLVRPATPLPTTICFYITINSS